MSIIGNPTLATCTISPFPGLLYSLCSWIVASSFSIPFRVMKMSGKLLLKIFQAVWASMVPRTGNEEETVSTQTRQFEGYPSSPATRSSEENSLNQPNPEFSEHPSSSRNKRSRSIAAFLLPLLCPCCYIMVIVLRYFHKKLCSALFGKKPGSTHQANRRRSSRDRPRSSRDRPRSSRDRPRSSRDRPRSSRDRPRSSRDRPRSSHDSQRTFQDVAT